MKRRSFLKSAGVLLGIPFVSTTKSEAKGSTATDRLKLSHLYPGAYHSPNDLWTPEEITEAGFVFVSFPTFIHRFDDPYNPIMKSYCGDDPNLRPMIAKTSRYGGIGYIKTYDIDAGRWRGMESVGDYLNKKDIFKPMILEWMKKMEYHYVYKVMLESSPCTWQFQHKHPSLSPSTYHTYALNVRGCKLPKKKYDNGH